MNRTFVTRGAEVWKLTSGTGASVFEERWCIATSERKAYIIVVALNALAVSELDS